VHTRSAQLRLEDAVAVGWPWVHHLAAANNIRALLIKGVGLEYHRLREPRVSNDIDVLVEPARFDDFVAAVERAGWRERRGTLAGAVFTTHSRTFVHTDWPCDLDIHRFFPGFLAEPATVFDELWRRRETMAVAHQDCPVPDRASSMLILALHSLRGTSIPRHRNELAHLTATVRLTGAEADDLAALAHATGSGETLHDVMHHLGVNVATHGTPSRELRQWRARVSSGSSAGYFWLTHVHQARGTDRLRLIAHGIWPSRADLLLHHPEIADAALPRFGARLARWGRGLRTFPAAVRALWTHRSGAGYTRSTRCRRSSEAMKSST
jgi:hypothetical protein